MKQVPWNRVVIKVGSALIAPDGAGCSSRYLLAIAHFIVRCRSMGKEVILVSSGSVAAGSHHFPDLEEIPIAMKKAMAAAGQTEMMAAWDKLFDFPSAQMLLTQGDLQDRKRYRSIRETVFELLEHKVLPILNENDAVTADALKVGDNDNLSAMVAAAVDADCLLICSDVDGLYDKNPNQHDDAELITQVDEIDERIFAMAGGSDSKVGTGGMRTKIEAAEKATAHGILTFILNGFRESSFNQLLEGNNPGTVFLPYESPLQEKVHWLTHTSKARGEVVVKTAMRETLGQDDTSLSHGDILDVKGDFAAGDTILVRTEDGKKLAKATARYSSCLLHFLTNDDIDDSVLETAENSGPVISEHELAILEK